MASSRLNFTFTFTYILQPGQNSRYRESLQDGLSGDRIPVGQDFSCLPDWAWGPLCLLYNGYQVFPGVKATGAWILPPLSSARLWMGWNYTSAFPLCLHRHLITYITGLFIINKISYSQDFHVPHCPMNVRFRQRDASPPADKHCCAEWRKIQSRLLGWLFYDMKRMYKEAIMV